MPEETFTCFFCNRPVPEGAGYIRIIAGVQGKGEASLNIGSCFDCAKSKVPTILEYVQKGAELKNLLGLMFRKA